MTSQQAGVVITPRGKFFHLSAALVTTSQSLLLSAGLGKSRMHTDIEELL
jgi:hypothetical protein